jgi:bifunctional DNA-binding transcriptional regulator/antitoxin component of YhaV-PrlF toxin-antitoxin module
MPKVTVRRGKLTISLSDDVREKLEVHDGDELEVPSEGDRVVLTPVPEDPLSGELEALDEAEQEFAEGKTRRLDDILHGLGRKVR